jgi:predicted ATP-grasp superfamily ATP-dependent carboligase
VQGHAPGVGVGVFLLMVNGHPRARFTHRRIHEVPHTGGVSSFRRACVSRDRGPSLSVLRRVAGTGGDAGVPADTGQRRLPLLELNARFWGSLHLALAAGVDFPRLLLDSWLGHASPSQAGGRRAVPADHPRELMHVWSVLRDDGGVPA